MTDKQVLSILQELASEFKRLAKKECHLQEDPNVNKDFHMGKEKAYYVAIDVIDDVERLYFK